MSPGALILWVMSTAPGMKLLFSLVVDLFYFFLFQNPMKAQKTSSHLCPFRAALTWCGVYCENSCVVGQCQIWIRWQRLYFWSSSCVRCTRYHVHPAVSFLLWVLTTLLENLKHAELSKGEYEIWLDPWCCFQSGDALYLPILHLSFP